MAGAAFAADITGAYQLDITAFSFNTQSKDFAVVKMPAKNGDNSNGKIRITTSDEKSGATLKVMGNDVGDLDGSIWFKPVDALTLSLSVGDIAAEATFGDLTLKGSVGKTVLDQTYTEPAWDAYVGYAIPDVASVKVTTGYDKLSDRDSNTMEGYGVIGNINTTAIPSTTLDVTGRYFNTAKKVQIDVSATETLGDIAVTETVNTDVNFEADENVKATLKVEAPVSDLKVGAVLNSANVLKIDEATAYAQAYLSGTYGVVGYEVALKLEGSPAAGATISVPVTAKVSF